MPIWHSDGQLCLASFLGPPEQIQGERGLDVGGTQSLLHLLGMLIQHSTWGSMLVPASVSSSVKWGRSPVRTLL